MKYEKPTIEMLGNTLSLVMGTKGNPPFPDSGEPPIISVGAYEADE